MPAGLTNRFRSGIPRWQILAAVKVFLVAVHSKKIGAESPFSLAA
jgi:hypothetical protein